MVELDFRSPSFELRLVRVSSFVVVSYRLSKASKNVIFAPFSIAPHFLF